MGKLEACSTAVYGMDHYAFRFGLHAGPFACARRVPGVWVVGWNP